VAAYCAVFLLVGCVGALAAENPPDLEKSNTDRPPQSFLPRLAYEFATQLQFPFRYARSNPKGFFLGAAGIAALVATDHLTYDLLVPEGQRLDDPAATLSRWGNTRSAYPLVLGFGAVGIVLDSKREKQTAVMLFESLLTSAVWTELLKTASGRERPRELEDGQASDWEGPGEGLKSFPSGHSTGIWAAATILANQYPRYKIVPVLAYGTATAMSYSRMVVGAHWLSDVVVGGLIGYGCARQVLATHRWSAEGQETPRLHMGLDLSAERRGIRLMYRF